MTTTTCKKCRQPLYLLNPDANDGPGLPSTSAFDVISSSTKPFSPPTRLSAAHAVHAYVPPGPPVRIARSKAIGHPAESFVFLGESVLKPARQHAGTASDAPATTNGHNKQAEASQDDANAGIPASLAPKLKQLNELNRLLTTSTSIDHPLCGDCIEQLLTLMNQQLDDCKRERDRLLLFERDTQKRKEEGSFNREQSEKDIAKLSKAESQAIEELLVLEETKAALEAEQKALDQEERQLEQDEEQFCRDYAAYVLESEQIEERTRALRRQIAHDEAELKRLKQTNVYNDAFCIGSESGLGTINSLRLGRLPNVPVEWPEINAAWGHTLLLLHTIARKLRFDFETYRLVPMGSYSRIEKLSGDKAVYELYGSGDFVVSRLLQNRRFDSAMVAFLDCLRQLQAHVKRTRNIDVPHLISKDRIGDASIRLQFGTDEVWTRALRHVLLNLKIILTEVTKE